MVFVAVDSQFAPEETVTEYVVVCDGETVMSCVVAPVFH